MTIIDATDRFAAAEERAKQARSDALRAQFAASLNAIVAMSCALVEAADTVEDAASRKRTWARIAREVDAPCDVEAPNGGWPESGR